MSKLYFYYSSMSSGKTTSLLQSSRNYQDQGLTTLLMKPMIDTREGEDPVIQSRIGISAPCLRFSPTDDLWQAARLSEVRLDCIMVDEAQFLTELQVYQLTRVVDVLGIPVLCYGLRTDFEAKPFPGSQWLLAWADKLIEIKGVCKCAGKATHVIRHDPEGKVITVGAQVEVGGNDLYLAVCRKHHHAMWDAGTIHLPEFEYVRHPDV